MENKYKIIFIGTSRFAVPALEKLLERGEQIPLVITRPDQPAGRQKEISPSPVKQAALKRGLELSQPEKISDAGSALKIIAPDLIVVAAYGRIIPRSIIELPRFKTINIHPSLLPKYRGASPIQTAILKGDKTTGSTLMLMDGKTDHGPIIAQKEISLDQHDDYPALEKKLAELSADLLADTLPFYFSGEIKPAVQDESRAVYAGILTREDGKIDWRKSAREIERKIRAFRPWPGTWTEFGGRRLKIIQVTVAESPQKDAVKTGAGWLVLDVVQLDGKRPMSGKEFFRGRSDLESERFENLRDASDFRNIAEKGKARVNSKA